MDTTYDSFPSIGTFRQKRVDMGDYREVFDSYHGLSKKTLIELRTNSPMRPYSRWASNHGLDWWKSYADLKHNRFDHIRSATLLNTLEALGALFLLNIIALPMIPNLVDHHVIDRGYYSSRDVKMALSEKEPLTRIPPLGVIKVKTALFGYVYETHARPWRNEEMIEILSPSYPGYL